MAHSRLRRFTLLTWFFLSTEALWSQKIDSIEWLSVSGKPQGLDDLVGKDLHSKEFLSAMKVLKSTEEYQDLEYRFDSGRLLVSAKEKLFIQDIIWNFPETLPSYVQNDIEAQLDLREGDALPEDLEERGSRLNLRLKTRGFAEYNLKLRREGERENIKLIFEFVPTGKPSEAFSGLDFKGIEDKDLRNYIAKKIRGLESMSGLTWTWQGSRYMANPCCFLKDDVELEDFRVTLRKLMRSRGFLNFEIDMSVVPDGDSSRAVLALSTRNLRQFEFQFEGQTFYFENELRLLLLENLSDRNFDIEEAKSLVVDAYVKKGFRDVAVASRIESVGSKYKVFFNVKEGPQYFFKGVEFRNVREEYLGLLEEAEQRWIEPFKSPFRKTYFDESGLKSSLGVLVDGIKSRGFLDVEVADYSFYQPPGSHVSHLKMSLRLGPRYQYSKFEVLDEEGVLAGMEALDKPKENDYFDGAKIQAFVRDLKKLYEDAGYLYSEVDTASDKILEKNQLLNTVAAGITVRRGPKVFLRNLKISGNSKTKKKVILREMGDGAIEYGEIISPQNLREYENRLLGTGLFSTVDLKPLGSNVEFRGAQTFIDYDLLVKERAGGAIGFGPGYRTDLGIVGFSEFSYRNLGGWNRGIFSKIQVSHKLNHFQFLEQDYSVSFVEPYPLAFRSRLRFDLRYKLDDDLQYEGQIPIKGFNTEETSFSTKLEKRVSEHFSFIATLFQYSLPRIFRIITASKETSQKYKLGGNGIEFLIDYRDNVFNPLSGWFLSENFEYFSPFMASNKSINFMTSKTRANSYFHLGKGAVFAISLGYDHLWGLGESSIIPENKRLTLGGKSSLRSLPENFLRFDEAGVAEERAMLGRFEFRMPLFSDWGIATFYEMGEIDVLRDSAGLGQRSTGLRHGAGMGIRYKTPVGPLSVDWGYNFRARKDEDDYQVSLSIGAF